VLYNFKCYVFLNGQTFILMNCSSCERSCILFKTFIICTLETFKSICHALCLSLGLIAQRMLLGTIPISSQNSVSSTPHQLLFVTKFDIFVVNHRNRCLSHFNESRSEMSFCFFFQLKSRIFDL